MAHQPQHDRLWTAADRYRVVQDAYLSGLEQAHAAGRDLTTIKSVASFFVTEHLECEGQAEVREKLERARRDHHSRAGPAGPRPLACSELTHADTRRTEHHPRCVEAAAERRPDDARVRRA